LPATPKDVFGLLVYCITPFVTRVNVLDHHTTMAEEDRTVREPLIRDDNDPNEAALQAQARTQKPKAVDTGAGAFVYALTFAAGVSGLLFGYE